MKNKKFVIVDAMAIAYRAYFAFMMHPLSNSKGEPTSAVFGFVNQLLKILEDNKPDYIAVAFDSHGKTFRHERYEKYKSSRQAMPEDMKPQLQRIKDIIEYLNIPIYILQRYEADDIIGTAVLKAEEAGLESWVITPDKDYNQLITDKVKIVKPGTKNDEPIKIYDTKRVEEEFGFEPIQMIDYLALVGDSSDDIPGVAGIGPKSATPLIQKFGTVENIYANIDEVDKAGIKNKLIANKENAFLSKELATIHREVPLEFDFEKCKFSKPNFDKLREAFIELEFKTLYSRLLNVYEANNSQDEIKEEETAEEFKEFDEKKVKYKLVADVKEAKKLAEYLGKKSLFVFDTETDGLNHFVLNLAGASFSTKAGEGYFVAINPSKEDSSLFEKDLSDRLPIK